MSTPAFGVDASREIHDLLGDGLKTRHITQPLEAIDSGRDDHFAISDRQHAFSVLGVEDQGHLVGSIQTAALRSNEWRSQIKPIVDGQVIDGDAPLLNLLPRLANRPWLFVRLDGKVTGFVSRSDLQRPPFRMLLFGLISLFEMRLLHVVKQQYPEAEIANVLNPGRLEKARSLHAERKTRGEELQLVDCLQIADKRDLLLALPNSPDLLGFESKKQACRFFARVEALRDRLVHANDLIAGSSWEEVLAVTIELANFLDQVLSPDPCRSKATETLRQIEAG
jgi:hypothetical protein